MSHPTRALEDWIDGFMEFTENSEPPRLYRLWTAVSTVAAALQRKCFLRWGHLTFYPNMYIVLVGPSGVRKGTAMAPGYQLLSDIGIPMAAQSTTLQALIRRLGQSNNNRKDPITGRHSFHSSLTIFSEELTVFIGYQQRELMAALCDWFDCKERWTYDTKNMGTDEVIGVWVNLIGATTPHLLQTTLPTDSIGGGLTSRMIFVYEEKKGKSVPQPFLTEKERDMYDYLRDDLEKIHIMSGQFTVTPGFVELWTKWYINQDLAAPEQLKDDRFGGYLQRRPTHVMKLSMILSAATGDSMEIDRIHLERALRLLETTEKKMPYAFSGVGRSPISDLIPRLFTYLAQIGEAPQSEIMKRFYFDADDQTLERVIRTLEQMNYVERHIKGSVTTVKFTGPEHLRNSGMM